MCVCSLPGERLVHENVVASFLCTGPLNYSWTRDPLHSEKVASGKDREGGREGGKEGGERDRYLQRAKDQKERARKVIFCILEGI